MTLKQLFKQLPKKHISPLFFVVGFSFIALINTTTISRYVRFIFHKLFDKKYITEVSSNADVSVAVSQLKRILKEKKVLGLDCEWVSIKSTRNPVALLQLATPDGFCCLFRLCCMKTVPSELKELLEDKCILKVGVAVMTDARHLLADYGVFCEGCLDLRHLATQAGVEPRGLAYLAKDLLGVELDKNWQIRCSNWESETLTSKQVQYAAEDACVAVEIFEKLNHKKLCQIHTFWKRLFWSKKDYWFHSYNLWLDYVGLNFTNQSKGSDDRRNTSNHFSNAGQNKPLNKRNYSTMRHTQHYSNIFLLAPDNEVLCTISKSKAAWYIEKELVDVVNEEPKTLKLHFEPSKRSAQPDGYYTKPKENQCVVCGSHKDLLRKNVVPSEYRKHFKEDLKNHNSHDVLLLCLKCHNRSSLHDQTLRKQLVVECEAPLGDSKNSKYLEVPDLRAVKSAARALCCNGDVIPQQRKEELKRIIINKLDISSDELTPEVLQELTKIVCFIEREHYVPHSLKVVQYYEAQGGVESLERRWRQHFLNTMNPLYLPPLWSVDCVRD